VWTKTVLVSSSLGRRSARRPSAKLILTLLAALALRGPMRVTF